MKDKDLSRHNWIKANRSWMALARKNYLLDTLSGVFVGLFIAVSLMIYREDSHVSLEILAVAWLISLLAITLLLLPFIYSALQEWREFDRILEADQTLLDDKTYNPTLRKLKAFLPFSRAYRHRPWRTLVDNIKHAIIRFL